MARVQLALNVPDLDAAIAFYSTLFEAEPAKIRPGYANFEVADPPLKLVLFESSTDVGRLNHLGVEVASSDAVAAHQARLAARGLAPVDESGTCCFAKQDKIWVDGPDGAWEIYAVLEDSATFGAASAHVDAKDALGCATVPESAARCCG